MTKGGDRSLTLHHLVRSLSLCNPCGKQNNMHNVPCYMLELVGPCMFMSAQTIPATTTTIASFGLLFIDTV